MIPSYSSVENSIVAESRGASAPAGRTESRARAKASVAHWKSPERAASRPFLNSSLAFWMAGDSGAGRGSNLAFREATEAEVHPAPRRSAADSAIRIQFFPFDGA